MRFAERSAAELAASIGATIEGDPETRVCGVAGLAEAERGDLSFLANPQYAQKLGSTRAAVVILGPGVEGAPCTVLRTEMPDLAFARAVSEMAPPTPTLEVGVAPGAHVSPAAAVDESVAVGATAVIGERARIGPRTRIWPGAYVGADVTIGADSVLHPHAVVYHSCSLGERVVLHAGAVVGSDGFGYAWDGSRHVKIPQVGVVVVEDDVEIGANTTIDRGRFGATVIGRGTKLDNLIQIAHNVQLGAHCAFAAEVGVAGSTQIGSGCLIGGQAAVLGHLTIGDGAQISATSWVTKSVPAGAHFSGAPARPHQNALEEWRHIKALGRMRHTVREMERRIEELEAKTDHAG